MQLKTYPKYKDSRTKWIGGIPDVWRIERYKIRFKYVKGKIPENPEEINEEGYLPYLNMEYLRGNEEGILYVYDPKSIKVNDGDLLLLWDGSNAGEFVLGKKGYLCSTMVKLNFKKINSNFSWYLCKSIEPLLRDLTIGMGIPHVSKDILENIRIPIPDHKEQIAIANFLDKKTARVDALIEKDKKLIELLKEKRTALINHAVTKGLDPNVKMKESGIEWIGKIPEGWKTSRLRFLGDSIIGLTYSPNDIIEEGSNSNLILRSSNIQNNKLSLHDNIYVNKKIPKKLITKKGDILICSRNGSRELIGKNIYIDDRTKGCSFGAFMMVYRTKYWRFMSLFFNSQVFKSQSGLFLTTTINQLTIGTLNNFYIAIPSNIEEQLAIASFLDKFTARTDKTIQKIQKKIKLLEEYKKSLIHHTVTGKIDVRGSEI